MQKIFNTLGVITLVAIIGLLLVACPADGDGGLQNGPEDKPAAERWSTYEDGNSTATIGISVSADEVCTITVGGKAAQDNWERRAMYAYTTKANTRYTYVFEAWTAAGAGPRIMQVMFYEDWVAQDSPKNVFIETTLEITSARTTYTLTTDRAIPKSRVAQLEFRCAAQVGTFYVKVLAITPYGGGTPPPPPGGGTPGTDISIEGTWNASDGRVATFFGNNFIYKVNGITAYSGTFSLSGSTITFNTAAGTASGSYALSGTTLTFSNFTWDNSVNGTYTKDTGGGNGPKIQVNLDVPTLTIDANTKTANWNAVPNADIGYTIKIDAYENVVYGTSYSLANLESGTYQISVKANGYETATHRYVASVYCAAQDYIADGDGGGDAYAIGDTGPGGGIIFYYNADGFTVEGYGNPGDTGYFPAYTAHYLEAAPSDQVNRPSWGASGTLISGVTTFNYTYYTSFLNAIGNGRKDTALIVAHLETTSETNKAAQICTALTIGGKNDWFLPSLGELNALFNQRTLSGINMQNVSYWSSSQFSELIYNDSYAWALLFPFGTPFDSGKGFSQYVRAIRAFARDGYSPSGTTKTNPTVTWPEGLTATVGQILMNVSLTGKGIGDGTFTWTAPYDSVGAEGPQSHNMTFTPTDTAAYNTLQQNVTVTVNAAGPQLAFELITSGNNANTYRVTGIGTVTGNVVNIPAIYNDEPVTEIQNYAFSYLDNVTVINIPDSVNNINRYVFYECRGLTAITVDANNPHYASEGGILYNNTKTALILAPRAMSGTVNIHASVISIGDLAFYGCTGLTSVTIPTSVTVVTDSAFGEWTAAQTIYVEGYSAEWEADAAWNANWRNDCNAKIIYREPVIDVIPDFTVSNETQWNNALNTIKNGGNYKAYTIVVSNSFNISGSTTGTFGAALSVTVTLKGSGTVSLNSNGNLIRVSLYQTLIIDSENLTLQGKSTNDAPLVYVGGPNAKLELRDGTISGNENTDMHSNSIYAYGGGVYVDTGAFFTMSGGIISNNIAGAFEPGIPRRAGGGGVYMHGTMFIMTGGIICSNKAQIASDSSSSYVTLYANGGGVFVDDGNFRIVNGTIYGPGTLYEPDGNDPSLHNTVYVAFNGNSSNTAGVAVYRQYGIAAEWGTFDAGGNWIKNGETYASGSDDTIKVVNGVLQP